MRTIIFAFSFLSLLLFQRSSDIGHGNLSIEFHDLSWAKLEISQISKIFPESEIYLYSDATESKVKSISSEAKILHFATHAKIDDEKPMLSKLILRPDNSNNEDGFLFTYEIYNMKISADLVVLSACNTGTGKLTKSEGIMSLARGFKYAGCPSIILGLWSIDDKSTASIMKNFYTHLIQGESISSSLRHAKIKYISDSISELAAPFYWAGLTQIGRDGNIDYMKK